MPGVARDQFPPRGRVEHTKIELRRDVRAGLQVNGKRINLLMDVGKRLRNLNII